MKKTAVAALLVALACAAAPGLRVELRSRVESPALSGRWQAQTITEDWDPQKTAIIICDMWDRHWCGPATERVGELAPAINTFVKQARELGVFIIHAPSETMSFYRNHPARRRAKDAPRAPDLPRDVKKGGQASVRDALNKPIDDSDGGCDAQGFHSHRAWTRQIETIEIDPDRDAITDAGDEVFNLLRSRGITNVMLVGVHTNMCVVNRPFALRKLAGYGFHAVLVRDLTDAMYNPARRPNVDHFAGTGLVIEHIEKYICPSTTSTAITGAEPFKFKGQN